MAIIDASRLSNGTWRFSAAAFRTFLSFRKQPGLRLAVAFSIGPDDPALGLPAAVDLFKNLTAWLVRERLNGLAFVTPAATPALCERLLVFVNVSPEQGVPG